ncbi:4-alpha-glucanotransferase [Rhizobium sp. BK060]|uniref:4-alpha-glucanotransferase n=1 Tax=Rhizobium sp. BK060 TaxID=2587096 RepID=UPI00161C4287|nr:4-alpha-glucanotransferase [Rhizobium sp. BK060]MBB3395988.1 4-alpha-glucanotransferase [Rhizobium sp. BK060]
MQVADQHETALARLAAYLGIERAWRDVNGEMNEVTDATLIAIATALGYPCSTDRETANSVERCQREAAVAPVLVTTEVGIPTRVVLPRHGTLRGEGGGHRDFPVEINLPPVPAPGYYDVVVDGHEFRLAVSPASFKKNIDLALGRCWGVCVQIPALRSATSRSFGNFGDLYDCVERFSGAGMDAILISPVHSIFSKDGKGFSPYSPSSRLNVNSYLAEPNLNPAADVSTIHEPSELIDWEFGLPYRMQELHKAFKACQRDRLSEQDVAKRNETTHHHAVFEVLDSHFRQQGLVGWRNWPLEYQRPTSEEVQRFARERRDEVDFHVFLQTLATQNLSSIQELAVHTGMRVGIINDLAIGVHPQGSDTWLLGDQMLRDLTIGAPPDPLGPVGQNWSLTTFSPQGLRRSGFKGFIEMLRASLRGAGGLRIDHVFGLARLWVIPEGRKSTEGAYLKYPYADLVRLVCLEAYLADAVVIGEDLGTKPIDFSLDAAARGLMGMQVMWFERALDNGFVGPERYDSLSMATTSTHDTPTVAGWWRGDDIALSEDLHRFPSGTDRTAEEHARAWDRGLLWSTFGKPDPRPSPADTDIVVDAALAHVARSNSALCVFPFEDLAGLREQTNVPGTIDEHPNWRRRYPADTQDLLDCGRVKARLEKINGLRKGGHR